MDNVKTLSVNFTTLVAVAIACGGPTPTFPPTSTATPTPVPVRTLIWPGIFSVDPLTGSPGDTIEVTGIRGYYRVNGSYDESQRSFDLFFDGIKAGWISCYVVRCSGEFEVPADAPPGQHVVKTEGRSPVTFEVLPLLAVPPSLPNAEPKAESRPRSVRQRLDARCQ